MERFWIEFSMFVLQFFFVFFFNFFVCQNSLVWSERYFFIYFAMFSIWKCLCSNAQSLRNEVVVILANQSEEFFDLRQQFQTSQSVISKPPTSNVTISLFNVAIVIFVVAS